MVEADAGEDGGVGAMEIIILINNDSVEADNNF